LRKNGFSNRGDCAVGGVDSSLVAAIAVDAVGARAFALHHAVALFIGHSIADAEELASRLDIEITTIPIEGAQWHSRALENVLDGEPEASRRELQSRIRGVLDGHLE